MIQHVMTFSDVDRFKEKYIKMISEYKHPKLLGLEHQTHNDSDGVTGVMDWYIQYGKENLASLKGEYPSMKGMAPSSRFRYTQIEKGKTLILSLPFSATGSTFQLFSILECVKDNDINVLIDAPYPNISGIGEIPFPNPKKYCNYK